VSWNLSAVLIWISFIAEDVKHFFMYLLAIFTSENCLFSSFAHLLIGSFVLLLFNVLISLYILDIHLFPIE
jgi:hypothetical protein